MIKLLTILFTVLIASFVYAQTPNAQFSVNSLTTCAGLPITFTNLSDYGGANLISTTWDFGEGGQSLNNNPTYTYVTPGIYQVLLTVITSGGTDFELKLNYITVYSNPTSSFTYSGSACNTPSTISFTNNSTTGGTITYNWDFGNGQTSTAQNPPAVTYNAAGNYNVSLVVTNTATGCTTTSNQTVTISNFLTNISANAAVCAGQPLTVADASSAGVNNWSWNSGNGQTSTNQSTTFTYNTPGTYTISLTSQNTTIGCSNNDSQTVTVLPLPNPSFTADVVAGCASLDVNFTNTSGAGGFFWNFGNGNTFVGPNPPTQTYTNNGNFNVSLTMVGANGCINTTTLNNMISVAPPQANFTANVFSGCSPLAVQFSDLSTSSNPLNDPIVSWLWDFGDGQTFNGQTPPAHSYNVGTYNVSLTITTQNGCTSTLTMPSYIEVGQIDLVDFSYFPVEQCAKHDVSFTDLSVISVPHDPSEVIYHWDFGDGGTSQDQNPIYDYPIDTGLFDVQLVVEFRGCFDTLLRTDQVHILAPISRFDVQTLYCNPISFPITVSVTDAAISGAITDSVEMIWSWGVVGDPNDTLQSSDVFDLNMGSITHDYTNYGSYIIKQVIHNYTTGCSDSTQTTIIISRIDAGFSVLRDSVCSSTSLTMTSTSTFLDPNVTYSYDMGDGGTATGNPATYSYNTSGTYNILLTATNAVGCSDTYAYSNLIVLPAPVANISATAQAGCAPTAVTYSNLSLAQAGGYPLTSFLWTFPDGSTQTTNDVNTPVSYNYTTQGNFTTTLVATDEFGCNSVSATIPMSITLPNVNFNLPAVYCDLQLVTATNATSGFGPLSYSWNIDDVFSTSNQNCVITFDETPGSGYTNIPHDFTLIATDGNGCVDSIRKTMTVDLPKADLNYLASGATANASGEYTCPPVFEDFTDSSSAYGTITNWNWDFGDGKTSVFQNPNSTYVFPGVYTLSLSITDEYGCTADTTLVDYLTILGPTGDLSWMNVGPPCKHFVTFSATNLAFVDSIIWNMDDGTLIYDSLTLTHQFAVGTYDPTGTLIDSLGCEVVYPMQTLVVPAVTLTANAGPDKTICVTSTNMNATNDPDGVGHWTLESGTGTIANASSRTTLITGLSIGTNTFRWTLTNECDTVSDLVNIVVVAQPTVATAGPDQFVCMNSATLAGNTPTVGVGTWTRITGSATITSINNPTTTVTGLSVGSNTFVWTITNQCNTFRDTVVITLGQVPTTANAGADFTFCVGTATLVGNTPTSGTGLWTSVNGIGTITNPTNPTTTVTGLTVGNHQFIWTITSGCGVSSDAITISGQDIPTTSVTVADFISCTTNSTLSANTPTSGTGLWTLVSGSGVIANPTNPVTTVTGLGVGANVFQWTITSFCGVSSDQLTITYVQAPTVSNAGPNQTICINSVTTLAGNTPTVGTGLWTSVDGIGTITTPTSPTSTVTGLTVGPHSFVWTISTACGTSRDTVVITGEDVPTPSVTAADLIACTTNSSVSANVPTSGTGIWTLVSGTGTIATPNSSTSNITGLSVGANVFQWTISTVCGTSSDQMTITLLNPPTVSNAGPNQTICINSVTTLAGNTPTVGTGLWTSVDGIGTITTPTSPTSTVTGLTVGPHSFVWTISNACGISRDTVVIIGEDVPTPSVTAADLIACTTNSSVSANVSTSGTGIWTLVSGTGTIATPSSSTSTISGLSVGANVFQWTISTVCGTSSDQMTINLLNPPTVSNAGPNQTICINSVTTLAGNTPTVGTGLWTSVDGIGTITTPTSPTSTVTGLTVGPHSFVWTISNACGISRDTVVITGEDVPTPSVTAADLIACTTNSSVSANVPTSGTGIWTLVSGTGTIATPNATTSNISGLSVGANVFEWTITTVCGSSTDQITITLLDPPTVSNAGPNQTICINSVTTLAGNTPTVGTGLWTSVDGIGTITTPTSPTSTVTGLTVGPHSFVWAISNACGISRDTVVITGEDVPTPSVTAADLIACTTNSSVSANVPTSGTGIWTLVSGTGTIATPSNSTSTISGLSVGANVFQWTISTVCGTSSDQMTITLLDPPTVSNAGPNQTICINSVTTLAGNTPTVGTGLWTSVDGIGTITTPTSPTSTVTGLTVGPHSFVWAISNACGISRDTVVITGEDVPTPSVTAADLIACTTNSSVSANVPSSGTGIWTLVSGAGTIATPNATTSTISGLSVGANVFEWTITTVCGSSTDQITITLLDPPTVSNAGPNQMICINSVTTLAGNTPTVGTGLWTSVDGIGTITTPSSPTSTVTGLTVGPHSFVWTISNACGISRDTVVITGEDVPTPSVTAADLIACTTNSSVSANVPTSGTGIWTLVSGTGTIATPNATTSTISGLSVGANVFEWTITTVCGSSTDQITITLLDPPTPANAGPDQSFCIVSTNLAGNTPIVGTGLWTSVDGIGTIVDPTNPTTLVTDMTIGPHQFVWTISNACGTSSDTVVITGEEAPTTSVTTPDFIACTTNSTLSANTPTSGTGVWTLVSGSGTITDPTNPTSTVTGLSIGDNVFEWTITSLCASSVDQLTITLLDQPTAANAGPDQAICITSATLAGNIPTVGTGLWTAVDGIGTVTNPTNPTSGVTGLTLGSYRFAWTISNVCGVSSDTVTITMEDSPTTALTGPDFISCFIDTVITGNIPTVGTGVWTLVSGTGTIANPTNATTSITGLSVGNNVFQWTISSLCGTNSDQITITVIDTPTVANAGPDQAICITSATLAGNIPIVGTGLWTAVDGVGTVTNPTNPTSGVTGLTLGSYRFAWTISNVCGFSSDTVTITMEDSPTTALTGPDFISCFIDTVITANVPTVGTGVWSLVSGSGTIANPTNATTSISGLSVGNNVFQWTISSLCGTNSDQITITVIDTPTVANAGPDQAICITSATLAGNTPSVGTGLWTAIDGVGTVTNPTNPTSGVTGLTLGSYRFAWTISNVCGFSSDTVTITMEDSPTTAVTGPDIISCYIDTVIKANVPIVGIGIWTLVSGSGTILTPTNPTSQVTGLGVGNNVFQWTISSLCGMTSDQLTVTVIDTPTVANAGPDQAICITTATLAGNVPTVGTGVWTVVDGVGVVTNPTSPTSTVTALTLGSYRFIWTISNVCGTTSDTVTITMEDSPTLASTGPDFTTCVSDVSISANLPLVGVGQWTLISGSGTIVNPTDTTTSITGLSLGTNVFQWTISSLCGVTSDIITITYINPVTTANAGPDQSVCSNFTNFAANIPVFGNGQWTNLDGIGTIVSTSNPLSAVNNLQIGQQNYIWTISNTCSTSSDTVMITYVDMPTTASVEADITTCVADITIHANTPTVGVGQWTVVSGTGTIADPSNPTAQVVGMSAGVNVFQWSISTLCGVSVDNLTINIETAPTQPNAGPDQVFCNNTTTLTANTALVGVGHWSIVGGGGTIVSPNNPVTTVNNLQPGNNIFTWTVLNTCDTLIDSVIVTRELTPTVSSAGPDQVFCGLDSTNTVIFANNPQSGVGVWSIISGSGTITSPLNDTTSLTDLVKGVNIFQWTISNSCGTSLDQIKIIVDTIPTVALTGPDQRICTGLYDINIDGNTYTSGTGLWTLLSGGGTIVNPNQTVSEVANIAEGTNVFLWTISNTCGTSSDSLILVNTGECANGDSIDHELYFYVPNTFTPDGDGINDIFLPIFTQGYDPQSYTLLIFNRWGELIFESHDTERGWLGTYGVGDQQVIVQDDTYVWRIFFRELANNKQHKVVGHVNVLK